MSAAPSWWTGTQAEWDKHQAQQVQYSGVDDGYGGSYFTSSPDDETMHKNAPHFTAGSSPIPPRYP